MKRKEKIPLPVETQAAENVLQSHAGRDGKNEKDSRHNRDINSKTVFTDPVLCAQFLRDNFDMPVLKNVQPEDIEDVSERYYPYLGTEFDADSVKKIRILDIEKGKKSGSKEPPFLISLIEHKRYEVIRIHDYSDWELLKRGDEMSLIMMINKIQNTEDLEHFIRIPADELNRIIQDSPEHIVDILASVMESLCFKIEATAEDRSQCVRKVKEREMGYLFENMEKISLQEQYKKVEELRKATEEQRKETEKQRKEAEEQRKEAEEQRKEAEEQRKEAEEQRKRAEEAEEKLRLVEEKLRLLEKEINKGN